MVVILSSLLPMVVVLSIQLPAELGMAAGTFRRCSATDHVLFHLRFGHVFLVFVVVLHKAHVHVPVRALSRLHKPVAGFDCSACVCVEEPFFNCCSRGLPMLQARSRWRSLGEVRSRASS